MIYGRKGIYIYTYIESTPHDPLLNENLLVATVTATVGATQRRTAQVDVTLLFQGEVLEDLSGFCTALWVLWGGKLQVGFS